MFTPAHWLLVRVRHMQVVKNYINGIFLHNLHVTAISTISTAYIGLCIKQHGPDIPVFLDELTEPDGKVDTMYCQCSRENNKKGA